MTNETQPTKPLTLAVLLSAVDLHHRKLTGQSADEMTQLRAFTSTLLTVAADTLQRAADALRSLDRDRRRMSDSYTGLLTRAGFDADQIEALVKSSNSMTANSNTLANDFEGTATELRRQGDPLGLTLPTDVE